MRRRARNTQAICGLYRTDLYLVEHIRETGTAVSTVVCAYAVLALNNMVHAAAFFMLLGMDPCVRSPLRTLPIADAD